MNAKLLAAAPPAARPICRLLRVTEEGEWTARFHAVSPHGIELTIDRPVRPAMMLTIVPQSGTRLLTVTSVRPATAGKLWRAACKFVNELRRDEWQEWLHHIQNHATCPLVRATEEGPWGISLRAVSPKGLELVAGRSFALGAFLTVELQMGREHRPRLLHVSKVRKDLVAGGWLIGGVLLSRLSEDELKKLSKLGYSTGAAALN